VRTADLAGVLRRPLPCARARPRLAADARGPGAACAPGAGVGAGSWRAAREVRRCWGCWGG